MTGMESPSFQKWDHEDKRKRKSSDGPEVVEVEQQDVQRTMTVQVGGGGGLLDSLAPSRAPGYGGTV